MSFCAGAAAIFLRLSEEVVGVPLEGHSGLEQIKVNLSKSE